VKHEYEKSWEGGSTKLKTCNPASKVFVTSHQPPQEVTVNEEVIFTYDVAFKVRSYTIPVSLAANVVIGLAIAIQCIHSPKLPGVYTLRRVRLTVLKFCTFMCVDNYETPGCKHASKPQ
jgi:hypothetical protein